MKCVRCEIIRAKLKAVLMYSLGYSIEEIVEELNGSYSGLFEAQREGEQIVIRRYPVKDGVKADNEGVVILASDLAVEFKRTLDKAVSLS